MSGPSRPRKRGGRRPGAGAPKGNLNGLRTGARSRQLKAVILALMAVPQTRRFLLHFARMEQRRRLALSQAANRYARLLLLPPRKRSVRSIQSRAADEDVRFLRAIMRQLEDSR